MSSSSNSSQTKEWFDVLVVIPLEEEVLTFMEVFEGITNRSVPKTLRYEVKAKDSDLKILLVQQEGMGRTHAARAASEALSEFDVGLVVCIGIAGSLSSDLKLGDVCYSAGIADVLDNARTVDTSSGMDIALSLTHYTTPREVVASFNFCRVLPELKAKYQAWQDNSLVFAESNGLEKLYPNGNARPNSADGLIVCAAVSKSEIYNQKLRAIDRKVLAVETESGGVFEEANRRSIPAVTIRGISDFANAAKNELEKSTDGGARKLAALNATTFLQLQFSNSYFIGFLERQRTRGGVQPTATVQLLGANIRDLASVVGEIGGHIDEHLRELSPDFRLQQKGYRLPTPRMRKIELGVSLGGRSDPIEIRDALQTRANAILHISRNYPDDSLAWVIANDLLISNLAGKQPIPIVINGTDISPPRSGLSALAGFQFDDIADRQGVQLVFIIDELPLHSRTRLKFLEDELKKYPNAKFLYITREAPVTLSNAKFGPTKASDLFELSGISFLEISHFVQKNFGMTGSEAEVVALRLRDTFRHFDLSAHPTYFAGIPRETLSALLQANRRGELIQLAVDGFLSFVVAGDTADVTLSRTTRSRFLKRLAVEINVEKRNFTQEEIIVFTKAFSAEFDFGIDPLAFVTSFIDAGILHFRDNRIEFSLPFIEAYVLASQLAAHEDIAIRYFKLGPDFDLNTFDIYAEIGASEIIVCNIIEGLEQAIKDYGLSGDEVHLLMTDKVRPHLISNPEKIDVIQKRLAQTAKDVELGKGDTIKKQKLLDIADRVKEEVADTTRTSHEENKSEEDERVALAIQNWIIATSLLGAGAEHLSAELKQMMAGLLVEMGSTISHRATEELLLVNFAELKKRLQEDPAVLQSFKAANGDKDDPSIKKFIGGLVDILEYSLFANGLRKVLHTLCEGARQRVLATSVEKADVKGPIESIIHAAWLTDIESHRGKDRLMEAIKQLPPSPFLRSLISAHFLTRVYWNHWRKEDRHVLLTAASEALGDVGVSLNKGELMRYIDKSQPPEKSKDK